MKMEFGGCRLSSLQKEDDLMIQVMKNTYLERGHPFPKITRIAGNIISPEIDLLYIRELNGKKTLTAYEFKLLKSKKNGTNYRHIYEGIGQAIMYFQYGIDFSYLLLGISNNALDSEPFIARMIHDATFIMKNGLRSFGIKIWRQRNPKNAEVYLKPETNFPLFSSKEYTLCRNNLLSSNFKYSKSFLDRIG